SFAQDWEVVAPPDMPGAAVPVNIHRNALVARHAVRALEKHFDPEEGEGWAVRLNGIEELLTVSRRQLPAVRDTLASSKP
ncbi:MAG: LytTR family DNA-binding domain-containing protein, partial [Rhodoferax sp.]